MMIVLIVSSVRAKCSKNMKSKKVQRYLKWKVQCSVAQLHHYLQGSGYQVVCDVIRYLKGSVY